MRKLTAVIAALGILGTTSLTPVFAASSIGASVQNDDVSSAAHMKKKKKKMKMKMKKKKMMQLAPTEMSAAAHMKKKKKMKMKKKKMSDAVIVYQIAA